MKRITLLIITAALALPVSSLAYPPTGCNVRLVTRAGSEATRTFNCFSNAHLYVRINGQEAPIADLLNRAATAAAFYGNQTIVRVSENGHSIHVAAETLLSRAVIQVQLTPWTRRQPH